MRPFWIATAFTLAAAAPAAAQAPLPTDLPWQARAATVRNLLGRIGFTPRSVTHAGDSVMVFTAVHGSATIELRTRFAAGRLVHAFFTAQGDSASVQREIDRSAATASARFGAPSQAPNGAHVWTTPNGRHFILPTAPLRLDDHRFGFGVAYHGG